MYKRILVPLDGSEAATLGLKEAIKLAKDHKVQIRLLHVVDESPAVSPYTYGAVYEDIVAQMRRNGESVLANAEHEARKAGVTVDTRLVEAIGEPCGLQIMREADAWSADLIVCGTHGRRGIRRLLMGSDAEYVVRHTRIPVLLVRSAPEGEPS